jgi:hypothetical protein
LRSAMVATAREGIAGRSLISGAGSRC